MDRHNQQPPAREQEVSDQEVDITGDDVLDLTNHVWNISDPLRDRSIPPHDVRPDSTTRGLDEADLTDPANIKDSVL